MTEWFRSRSREDWWLYLVMAGGVIVFGIVVYFIYMTYTPAPTTGPVVDREFIAAHREDDPPMCMGRDKNGNCTFWIPQSHWEDDAWFITIHGCAVARDGKERCRTNRIEVSETIYHQCQLNRTYRPETRCLPQ